MATKAAATGGRRWRGDDFPAWLSPMLVKELRQGIQSGAFAWTFVALQIAMVVLFVFWVGSVSADDTTRAGSFYRGVFWLLLGVACVFVLPLRGLQAVKSEEAGQTFDLLRLTRLTSTQIVVGKWLAIVAQIGLITVAVLPYVVLQYFLGGYAVIDDLLFVAGLVVVGGVVTAAAIAASNQPQWIRATLGAGMGLLVTYAAGGAGMFFGMFGLTASGTLLAVEVLFGGMVVLVLLEYAAAGIAPRAENHALRKRLLATAMVALAVAAIALQATYVAAGRIPPWGSVGVVAALVALQSLVATWIMVAELLTDPVRLRVIYEPFARRGAIGRALATLLTPGWATALPLAMLFAAAWVTMLPAFVRVVGGTPPAGAGTLRWYSLVGVAAVLGIAYFGVQHIGDVSIGAGIAFFAIMALMGAPLFTFLGGLALFLWVHGSDVVPSTPLASAVEDVLGNHFARMSVLPTIPIFTLAGYLMSESNTPKRLVRVARALLGWMPGGLAVVCVLASAAFTVFSGASGITIVAIGGLLFPALIKDGYPEKFSLGLVTSGGALGITIVPCLPLIVYGIVAGLQETPPGVEHVELQKMIVAGILPGLLVVALMAAYAIVVGVTKKIPRSAFDGAEAAAALWEAKWELALPLVVGKGPAHLARALDPHDDHLLVLDWRQAGAGALEVAEWLARDRYRLPHVAVVAPGSVPMSVQALRNGACEAVELALPDAATGDGPDEIVERSARTRIGAAFSLESHLRLAAVRDRLQLADLRRRHAGLREIERTTLLSMVAGTLNKQVAQELRIAEERAKAVGDRVFDARPPTAPGSVPDEPNPQ